MYRMETVMDTIAKTTLALSNRTFADHDLFDYPFR